VGCYRQAGIWNVETGQFVLALDTGKPVRAVAYSPDGRLAATGAEDGTVNLWAAPGGRLLRRLVKHEKAVRSVAFSADGQHLLSGGDEQNLRLCVVETGEELGRFQAGGAVHAVAFCPDGQHVLSAGADGCVRLWSLTENDPAQ
jgi:WD40 repeat protein